METPFQAFHLRFVLYHIKNKSKITILNKEQIFLQSLLLFTCAKTLLNIIQLNINLAIWNVKESLLQTYTQIFFLNLRHMHHIYSNNIH